MIEVTKVVIDKMTFQLLPLPLMKVLKLDKKLLALLLPAMSGFKNLDAEIDFEAMSRGISEALTRMKDDEFESFALDLLSCTSFIPGDGIPVELTSVQQMNAVFSGKILTLYKVLFAVMKHNKFSPFALLEGGGDLKAIITGLLKQDQGNEKNGAKSGKLER